MKKAPELKIEPHPEPAPRKPYELPAVRKMEEGGWGLFMLTIQSDRVVGERKLHGPDIRRVCLAKAIRILER